MLCEALIPACDTRFCNDLAKISTHSPTLLSERKGERKKKGRAKTVQSVSPLLSQEGQTALDKRKREKQPILHVRFSICPPKLLVSLK